MHRATHIRCWIWNRYRFKIFSDMVLYHLTTRRYDFFQFHIGQFSYQALCKGRLIFLYSPLHFLLSINFIFSKTCISHRGCKNYSNLWSSDKWKMDLQVKKLKVDISATPKKNSDTDPYHQPQGRDKLLIPPVKRED